MTYQKRKLVPKAFEGSALGWLGQKFAGKKGRDIGNKIDTIAAWIPGVGQITAGANIIKNVAGLARDARAGKNVNGRLVNLGADALAFLPGGGGLLKGVAKAATKGLVSGTSKQILKTAAKDAAKQGIIKGDVKKFTDTGRKLLSGNKAGGLWNSNKSVASNTWRLGYNSARLGLGGWNRAFVRELVNDNDSFDKIYGMPADIAAGALAAKQGYLNDVNTSDMNIIDSSLSKAAMPVIKALGNNVSEEKLAKFANMAKVAQLKDSNQKAFNQQMEYLDPVKRKQKEDEYNKYVNMLLAGPTD